MITYSPTALQPYSPTALQPYSPTALQPYSPRHHRYNLLRIPGLGLSLMFLAMIALLGTSCNEDSIRDDEMNFHYEAMEDLALDVLPNPQGNKVIAQIEVGYNLLASGNTTIFHSMLVVMASKITDIGAEQKEAIPLPIP